MALLAVSFHEEPVVLLGPISCAGRLVIGIASGGGALVGLRQGRRKKHCIEGWKCREKGDQAGWCSELGKASALGSADAMAYLAPTESSGQPGATTSAR